MTRLGALLLGTGIAACSTEDVESEPPAPLEFAVLARTELPLLSVWGDGEQVLVAGGNAATGSLFRLEGTSLVAEDAPPGPRLWWLGGRRADALRACGEGGRILARDAAGRWAAETTGLPADAVLYGVFAVSDSDWWAVGGSVTRTGPKGVVLRSSGDGVWTRIQDPALPTEDSLFKVFARSPEAVYLVGEAPYVLRYDGRAFTRQPLESPTVLFTAHGAPGAPTLAVGGTVEGVVVQLAPGGPVAETLPQVPPLNGVFVSADGAALASGQNGVVLRRTPAGEWQKTELVGQDDITLHAVYADDGRAYAVGGDLAADTTGVLLAAGRSP